MDQVVAALEQLHFVPIGKEVVITDSDTGQQVELPLIAGNDEGDHLGIRKYLVSDSAGSNDLRS